MVTLTLDGYDIRDLEENETSDYYLLRPLFEELLKEAINNRRPHLTGKLRGKTKKAGLLRHALRTAGFIVRTEEGRVLFYLDLNR